MTKNVLVLAALATIPSVRASAQQREAGYAQGVLTTVAKRHGDLRQMDLAARRGDGCVTVAATDRGDIGDACDATEKKVLRTGEPDVGKPTRRDPVYMITEQLRDASGAPIGLIILDLDPRGESADAALARARAIRSEVESQITSVAQLFGDARISQASTPDTSYKPRLDARRFAAAVTNPFHPLTPGTTFRFRATGKDSNETQITTVTSQTRAIMGIKATVVHDQVFDGSQLKEDTYDWYAQDADGNVWYLGEDTKEYLNGRVVSTEGSWAP